MVSLSLSLSLSLNDIKTKFMLFKKKSVDLSLSDSFSSAVHHLKNLGVTFQDNLSWNEHIE